MMSEETRHALRCGTLTGIDIEQVRAARERLASVCHAMPEPEEAPPLLTVRVAILAGLLAAALMSLCR